MTDSTADTPTPSLQDELRRLEDIVRRLESEDVDLDAALSLFEEGVARLRSARERLADAETKVRRVIEQADGTLELPTSMSEPAAGAEPLLQEARSALTR
jgi:exodeoxyribonuclease VII small subunit